MHFDMERIPLLVAIIIIIGVLSVIGVVSFADEVSISSTITILPIAQYTIDIGKSYVRSTQTWSGQLAEFLSLFTPDNAIVTAHFAGMYNPAHLQTMSVTVKDRTTTPIMDNVRLIDTSTTDLEILPQLGMNRTDQCTLIAYGFTIGMKSVETIDHVDLAAETADIHASWSETVGAEFGYPRTPRYPGERMSGLNIIVDGSVSYPGFTPRAELTITAHSSTGDIRMSTNWESGEASPRTTISAALRMGGITLTGDTTLFLAPYRVAAGTVQASFRSNGLSLALVGTWPTATIAFKIGYQCTF